MKRLPQPEIDRIAAAVVRDLVCRHGLRNLARIRLAIRREVVRQLVAQDKPQSPRIKSV